MDVEDGGVAVRLSCAHLTRLAWATLLLGLVLAAPVSAEVLIQWKDRFSEDEKTKLTAWITEVVADAIQ